MTTILNASATNGLQATADGSGVLKVQSNGVTTNALAWVSFNGTTGAIFSSYNVSSITRNAAGDYTINFTSPMADANYVVIAMPQSVAGGAVLCAQKTATSPTTSSVEILTLQQSFALGDSPRTFAVVFGN